jgi:hypothetical protein
LIAASASALWRARRWLAPRRAAPPATTPATTPRLNTPPKHTPPSAIAPSPAKLTPPSAIVASPPKLTSPSAIVPSPASERRVAPQRPHVRRPHDESSPDRVADATAPLAPAPAERVARDTQPSPPVAHAHEETPSRRSFDPEESALVHAAMRALRVERQPRRARTLLDDYLGRFPDGALVEDALALAIEAAITDGDTAGARRFAGRYLAQFPSGRLRALADEVLRDPSMKSNHGSYP